MKSSRSRGRTSASRTRNTCGAECRGSPPATGTATGWGGWTGARRGHRTHADGHEVRKDDGVPQVVEPAVAEEELGALQEWRPVLGPRRALGAGGTRMLRNVGRPAGATGGPTVPAPPILGFGFL